MMLHIRETFSAADALSTAVFHAPNRFGDSRSKRYARGALSIVSFALEKSDLSARVYAPLQINCSTTDRYVSHSHLHKRALARAFQFRYYLSSEQFYPSVRSFVLPTPQFHTTTTTLRIGAVGRKDRRRTNWREKDARAAEEEGKGC